jgi:hypothetical protein
MPSNLPSIQQGEKLRNACQKPFSYEIQLRYLEHLETIFAIVGFIQAQISILYVEV